MSTQSPDRPLSIAIVTGSMSRLAGGLFNSVRRSAIALDALGHNVTVMALADEHSARDLAAWAPLKPLVAPRKGPAALGYSPAIGQALSEGQFDVVHQHGIWQAFSAQTSAWRKRTGGPVMISPRGMLDPWALSNSGWKKKLTGALWENANLRTAASMHALNASEAQSMRSFGLTNAITTIPNGADLPADIADDKKPPKPNWWPAGETLLFIGRIHPKKGISELIEAFAKANLDDWNVVIAGWDDGGHLAHLREQIVQYGLEKRIILPGSLYGEEKDAALRHADAFVLPSFSEGLPMSVLEAWAYRLPVLMTRECNLPDGFTEGAALEISTKPAAMIPQLQNHLGDTKPAEFSAIGAKGRALVEARYSWEQIARDHVEVYRWMIGSGADAPACVEVFGGAAS